VYGYAILAAGVCIVMLTRLAPLRLWPALLLLIPAMYVGLRYSGAWDGGEIVNIAQRVQEDRVSSVRMRIDDEQRTIDHVRAHDPWLGFGDEGAIMGAQTARTFAAADGWWVHIAGRGGAVGLVIWLCAFGIAPLVALFIGAPRRIFATPMSAMAWGVMILIALNLLDALHNQACFPAAAAMIGALSGSCQQATGKRCGLDKPGKTPI